MPLVMPSRPKTVRRLLIYDDSETFGGHEVMAIEGVKALLLSGEYRLTAVCSQSNEKLVYALEKLAREMPDLMAVLPMAFHSRKLQGLRNRYCSSSLNEIESILRGTQPQAMLALQGDVELSSAGIYVARKIGLPVLSYLALPHHLSQMGAKLGWVRDLFNRYLYNLPDAFITLSESMAAMLRAHGTRLPIHVVHNGVDFSKALPCDRTEGRRRLGLPLHPKIIGMVGRIEFKQKGHDFCLRALESHWEALAGYHFCVVGDGPDQERLHSAVAKGSWVNHFTWIPWTGDLGAVYSALDVLAMPSRFEGVPLVMLEAMYHELPIVASQRDGMAEMLPTEWLFPYGEIGLFVDAIVNATRKPQSEILLELRQRVQERHSLNAFRQGFLEAVKASLQVVTPVTAV